MEEVRFCFEVSAEAGMATDMETGESTTCLMSLGIEMKERPSEERYSELAAKAKTALASQLDMPEEWLTPISEAEYDKRSQEDEEE